MKTSKMRSFSFLAVFLTIMLIMGLVSCNFGPKLVLVEYDSDGGSTVISQEVEVGNLVDEPVEPTLSGYAFGGWYTDLALTQEWDFTTDTVVDSMTLYAKWFELWVSDITNSWRHTIIAKQDGTVWGVGYNGWGQLGDGTTTSTISFSQMMEDSSTPLTNASAVSANYGHTMILKNDGTLWATGYNYSGQLGDGTNTNVSYPEEILVDSISGGITAISAGRDHSMILKGDGTLWATGQNTYGQLGDGTTGNTASPVQVMENETTEMTNVVSVSAGTYHTMFIKEDGTLWATGQNTYGKLGDGTSDNTAYPVQVMENDTTTMTNVVSVSAGGSHTMILKGDGTLWGAGYNYYGQLGNGTTANATYPVQVMVNETTAMTNVAAVFAGGDHTMILKEDGTLWAVGSNAEGQFGNGTKDGSLYPTQVMSDVDLVSCISYSSIILKHDGTLWATGRNDYAQLGFGPTEEPISVPVEIVEPTIN